MSGIAYSSGSYIVDTQNVVTISIESILFTKTVRKTTWETEDLRSNADFIDD